MGQGSQVQGERTPYVRQVFKLVTSRALGRNLAYVQNYFHKGSPKQLDEDDRLALAQRWNVDERELGAREPWRPVG